MTLRERAAEIAKVIVKEAWLAGDLTLGLQKMTENAHNGGMVGENLTWTLRSPPLHQGYATPFTFS